MEKKDIVLIADDDEAVLSTLVKTVKAGGFDCRAVKSGFEALDALAETAFDLVLMDINMKGLDGFDTIRELRARGYRMPVIIVSGRKEDVDTLYGLDIGADDYVTKPFNPVTLGAKIKALIRLSRGGAASEQKLQAGPFTYDLQTLRFYKNGEEIDLSAKENAIVKLFMDNVNRIFSKDMLYDMVWNNALPDENAVMVYINRIRQKIEDNPSNPTYIRTVRGIGYRFVV